MSTVDDGYWIVVSTFWPPAAAYPLYDWYVVLIDGDHPFVLGDDQDYHEQVFNGPFDTETGATASMRAWLADESNPDVWA